ncbi:MAG TPA: hypothetical protein VHM72_04200 [Solirubrobacteraceae bacterium]|nr:hypothetical protein [Solirubrobacteraceae bacterium]
MAGEPTPPLSPDSVAARVAEILGAAARDARAIVEAAWNDASLPPPVSAGVGSASNSVPASSATETTLASLDDQLTALTARVARLESAINTRLEGLRQVLAPEGTSNAAVSAHQPDSAAPASAVAVPTRAERVRAVDLALQGYSRVQIAAELRSSMHEDAVEQLLDEVLERT